MDLTEPEDNKKRWQEYTEELYKFIKISSDQISRSVVSNFLRPMDCSPPSSSIHGILQARILEWVAISFSKELYTKDLHDQDNHDGVISRARYPRM